MKSVIKSGVFLILFVTMGSCYAQLILRFQPEVNETASRLGDVLMIKQSASTVFTSKTTPLPPFVQNNDWASIPLDSHPIPGELVTKARMLHWMRQRVGPFQATWLGKTSTEVKQTKQSSGKLLVETAQSALIKKLNRHYLHVQVTPLSHLKDSAYALDELQVHVTVPFPTPKRVCVWLSNREKSRTAVWFKVHAYANVLVSNHDIKRNTLLDSNAFSMKKRDIAGLQSPPALTLPANQWLKSSMSRNTILLESQLKAPPLILKNQHVKVVTHHHHITIEMDTIALVDGCLGETITVKSTRSQKTFTAQVTGFQQAEIQLF